MNNIVFTRKFEEKAKYGNKAFMHWRMLGARGKTENILELCQRNNLTPAKVLEVGCGDGSILHCLSNVEFIKELYGLEISKAGVETTLKRNIEKVKSCIEFDGHHIPYEDRSFDLVILSHVLEHVEFERAVLREIKRVSKHQIIEVPLEFNSLPDEKNDLVKTSFGHINIYSPNSLRFLLHSEDFTIIDEMLKTGSLAVEEHVHFEQKKNNKTEKAVNEFRSRYKKKVEEFNRLPKELKQTKAAAFCVLVKEETPDEKLNRAIRTIEVFIQQKNFGNVKLVFDTYIPKEPKFINLIIDMANKAGAQNIVNEFKKVK